MEKKIGNVDQKLPGNSGIVTATTKIKEVESKMPVFSSLVKKTGHNAKISDNEKNLLLLLIIINLQNK